MGVNDLDTKDFAVVFQELENIIETIRCKYPNIKIIISESTPRNDARDIHVKHYNKLLSDYNNNNQDIYIANHKKLRDPTWSMFEDSTHIRKIKIPKFAANIIKALKQAYNIKNKSELFKNTESPTVSDQRRRTIDDNAHNTYNNTRDNVLEYMQQPNLRNRLRNIANYFANGNNVHADMSEFFNSTLV